MKRCWIYLFLIINFSTNSFTFSVDQKNEAEIFLPNPSEVKVIVFDYGGVLAKISMTKTAPFLSQEFQVSEEDIKSVFRGDYIKHRMDLFSDDDFWNLISRSLNTSVPEGINERYKKEIYTMLSILKDKKELIRNLRLKGYKVCLLSNQYPHFNDVLKDQKVFDEFDISIVSCDYHIKKPSKRLYEILLEKIGERASSCLFIDDTYENIEAAKELGFNTFYYNVFKHSDEVFYDVFKMFLSPNEAR